MNELFAAITTRFKTVNDLNTSLSGQMFPHEAEQNATFPYGVYYLISDINDFNFTDDHEIVSIQFSLFSDDHSPTQVFTLFSQLKALFDDVKLTVAGYENIRFQRGVSLLDKDEEMDTWTYIVEYDILLERQRT